MKKAALLAFGLSAIINTVTAQFYLSAGGGYSIPMAGQVMTGNIPFYTYAPLPLSGSRSLSTYTDNYSVKSGSFGAGGVFMLGFGYMFNDHIGIQLDGVEGVSNKSYSFTDNNYPVNYTSGTINNNITITQQAKSFAVLIPALVLQTGGEKVNVYTRFGLALPVSSTVTQDVSVANAPGTGAIDVADLSFQVKSSFSMGLSAAAGVKYKLSDRFSIWGEVSVLSLSINVKQADFKSFSEDGTSYPVSQVGLPLTVKYSKTASLDSTGNTAVTYSQPFSNMGFHVGFSVLLSNKREKHSDLIDNGDDDNRSKNFKRKSH